MMKDELSSMGYSIEYIDNEEEICYMYFNLKKRLIEPKPREIFRSKEFFAQADMKKD